MCVVYVCGAGSIVLMYSIAHVCAYVETSVTAGVFSPRLLPYLARSLTGPSLFAAHPLPFLLCWGHQHAQTHLVFYMSARI